MDKKNTIIGVALLVGAFVCLYVGQRFSPPPPPRLPVVSQSDAGTPAPAAATNPATPGAPLPSDATFAAVASDSTDATITTLSNDFIKVNLTDFGGAIRDVAFQDYKAELGKPASYVFNDLHADPILAFTEESNPELGRTTRYQIVSASPTEVVYRAVLGNRIEVTRRYVLRQSNPAERDDPSGYVIRHETTFRNLTNGTASVPHATFSLGTASLVSPSDYGQYLNVANYDGSSTVVTDRGSLEGAGFVGRMFGRDPAPKAYVEKGGPVVWAAVKNQFFVSIFTADKPGQTVITRRIDLPRLPGAQTANIGLTGAERFDLTPLAAGASAQVAGDLYVGPKEYPRLAKLAHNEDGVMQYGTLYGKIFLSVYVAPFMNTLMHWTQRWVGNWGLAIVLMTLIIKTVSLPFTLAASRSAKRMQKFQPQIAALKEKFKDNPQKLNQATLALFKEHKINPMGGCLPMLITMPLFIGFYTMLQSSAELRFQSFLWASDLSVPDTVMRLYGFPLNIMPLLMGATMLYQMRLTPQPTADNAQMKMMKFMPVIFMFFCYSLSCALSIYMTVNGLFTIGQQLVINRMKDDDPASQPVSGTAGMKNVTPAKKKLKK